MERYITPEQVMSRRFLTNPAPAWELAIICFRDYKGSQILVQHFQAKPLGYKVLYGIEEFEGAPVVYEADVLGKRIGIITRCNWGAPQAAILVEELAALGVKSVIGFGAAGSIRSHLVQGTQLVVHEALCNDGTSRIYSETRSVAGSAELRRMACAAADKVGCGLAEAAAATVDALYRETKELVLLWQAEGADIINMESGALYAASERCGVAAIWLGFVSDCLVKETWEDWHVNLDEMAEVTAAICRWTVFSYFQECDITERAIQS